ncbi:2Fe-2S iron-sulfur cluster-binding protein [Patiriisocius hiemis]|uniref:2Fe-2S iron-sulfur cluster-binding protein n=1 Tax=Patiriisocius hiemis TaxID=3075604 RepID=A0ABU2YDV3_9FLAO|nr:2Fe-2S iron-sulfur cluster-binding protein [Constantimarinum sp. W242]MDT0556372.1 2Fe-2S iron-sulfur cluster-binding protein [Constantimarinum sp. W242]
MKDITIHIKDREGNNHTIQAPTDMNMNLMEVIKSYELASEGTIGVCGGMAMCASCQCYIESEHELPEISDAENAMLAEAFYVENNSRLGCQIFISENLDGLSITLAPEE